MSRRFAILDDNDGTLRARLATLQRQLPPLVTPKVVGAAVIGSVAEGRARDASDIDVLLVLREGGPTRADYRWWDQAVAPRLAHGPSFPVEPIFVAHASLRTDEPNLRAALRSAYPLWDPENVFDDQSEPRA